MNSIRFQSILKTAPIAMGFVLFLACTKKTDPNDNSWFDKSAENCDTSKGLHFCSNWDYLGESQFEEMVMDGVKKLNPPLKDSESVYEFGTGVGAALKVLNRHTKNLAFGGSDISEAAIKVAKDVFPDRKNYFHTMNMIEKHHFIPDNTYDHVFSFGALGMYLKKDEMLLAVREATRITKPGGSLLFTHFIEPSGFAVGTIVDKVEKSFWLRELPKLGLKNVVISSMKYQGDRYQISATKS